MAKTPIRMGRGLALPADAVTQTFGFIARKGGGKTYAAQKLAEQMLDQRAQVVVLDPIGNWWALRLGADGKRPAYEIPVFGGLRGDLPLNPNAGQLVADTLADTQSSAVVDVSQFRKQERKKFVTDFCEQLFLRRKADPSAMHMFVEEAQVFAPQQPGSDGARMLGALEDIVRLGRNFGIGSSLISQRPQSVNKEVLNQVECLMMFQISGAHERKAVRDWVTYKGIDVADMLSELPSLPIGTAYVWSPQWLRLFKRVAISKKTTYDASATPRVGSRKRAKKIKPIDLDTLERAMESVVEEQHANDPKKLRAKIRKLERDLKTGSRDPQAEKKLAASEKRCAELEDELDKVVARAGVALSELDRLKEILGGFSRRKRSASLPVSPPKAAKPQRSQRATTASPKTNGEAPFSKSSGLFRMLVVLAQFHPHPCPDRKIGLLADLSVKSGTFSTYLGRLRSYSYVEGPRSALRITDGGLAAVGDDYEPLPTDADLRAYWIERLGGGKRRLLEELVAAYPNTLTKPELAERAELSANSGTFSTYLGKLRTLDLVEGRADALRAAPMLFGDD